MNAQQFDTLGATRMNRRSLIVRAGLVGAALPVAGMLLNACAGSNNDNQTATEDTASQSNTNAQPLAPADVTIVAKDLFFEPGEVSVAAGQPVRLTFVNQGAIEHDWGIADIEVTDLAVVSKPDGFSTRLEDQLAQMTEQNLPYAGAGPNQQMVIEFTPTTAGTFAMSCMVTGHKEAGMTGSFIATGAAITGNEQATPMADAHVMATTTTATGTPYDAERLPSPAIAAPIGVRAPMLVPIEVEIQEVIGYLDDGVAYQFWTFGGTVPGPLLRVAVGDTVELTLKNPAESLMPHNIDLHAVTGPGGGGKVTTVAPGQSATFRFKALNPGIFVYHCATPPIPHHIMSGMYGLIVVEPEGGLAEVDREFYVMQGDFYLEGQRGEKGLRAVSMDKLLDERPDYIVFNGAVGALTEERALKANVGETVRIFFGVGGPNVVSSFHVIGEIFDRVYPEGASEPVSNVQTTLVPAGGATMVEFTCEVPGTYMLVDHSLGRLAKGAVGMLVVEGEANAEIFEVVSPPS
jgi:nitrite reductase (NO-forming)